MDLPPLLLLLLTLLGPTANQGTGPCCDIQTVSGHGDLDGMYTLKTRPTASIEDVCLNDCVYSKFGQEISEFCFKASSEESSVECSALPTEPEAGGSTVTQSVDGLQDEKKSLDTEIAKDEAELKALVEEEEAATAVDAEIDGVQAKIDQLTSGDSGRNRRQAATSCVEIGTLVDDMIKQTETKKKLVYIRRITQSTIISCTGPDDKQFLVVQKETFKVKIKQLKDKNQEIRKTIVQQKYQIQFIIVKNKKKIEKILEKINAIQNPPTTTPMISTGKVSVPSAPNQTPMPTPSAETASTTTSKVEETPKPMPELTSETPKTSTPSNPSSTEETSLTPETPIQETPRPIETNPSTTSNGITIEETPRPLPSKTSFGPNQTPKPTPAAGEASTTTEGGETPKPMPSSTTEKPKSTVGNRKTTTPSNQGETPKPMPSSTTGNQKTTTASSKPSTPRDEGETPKPMPSTTTGKPKTTTQSGWSSTGETPKGMSSSPTTLVVSTTPLPSWSASGETPKPMGTGWSSTGETPLSMKSTVK